MSKHAETTTSHRAVLAETAGEPARPVCVLRSDVPGLGNIQLLLSSGRWFFFYRRLLSVD